MRFVVAYVAAGITFLALDVIWLTNSIGYYRKMLGGLLAEQPNFAAAAAFYVIYLVGITAFAIMPAAKSGQWSSALTLGGLLGFVAYATYDLTNMATLSRWPLLMTVIDLAWGVVITASAALAGFYAVQLIAPVD